MGHVNTAGVYVYDETDDEATFSDLLNLQTDAVTVGKAAFRGPAAARAALTPAPPGATWQDTDGSKLLWSPAPDGTWRRHAGRTAVPLGAFTGAAPVFFRSATVEIPTILAATETLLISQETHPEMGVMGMAAITRGPASTSVDLRHIQLGNTNQKATNISWLIVPAA